MRSRSNSSSISATVPAPISASSNEPVTLEHFKLLMDRMQHLILSVERVEKRQDDLISQLAACTSTLNDHSKILSEHQSSLEKCSENIEDINRSQAAVKDDLAGISERVCTLENNLSSASTSSTDFPEVLERFKKSHNVILVNVPENGDTSRDMEVAGEIVDHIHRSSSSHLKSVERLPAKDASRPRWMRVIYIFQS